MPARIPNWVYRAAAHRKFHDEGTVEVDDLGKVSRVTPSESTDGAHGAYVQAWVWIYDDDVTPKDRNSEAQRTFQDPRHPRK